MKGGSYRNNSYKMMWHINDGTIARTIGYVKDSPRIDISKLRGMH